MNICVPNNADRFQKEKIMSSPHGKNGHKTAVDLRNAQRLAPGQAGPTADRIRARAYELYRERNGGPGDSLSDWLRAEAEITREGARCNPAAPEVVPTGGARRPSMDEYRSSLRGDVLLRSGE